MSNSGPSALAQRIHDLSSGTTLHVGGDVAERLAAYTTALLELGRQVNLTAAKTAEAALEILVLPSLGIQATWPVGVPPRLAVDIGSGNGFPGVAVAATWPEAQVVLVERRAKKARAIQACLETAGFEQVAALACDAREIKNERPDLLGAVDLVTVRAVGSLAATTKFAAPLLAPCGRIVHWKSATLAPAERREGAAMARTLGLEVLEDVAQPVGDGILVVYTRSERRA